jgi:hypothetical protein
VWFCFSEASFSWFGPAVKRFFEKKRAGWISSRPARFGASEELVESLRAALMQAQDCSAHPFQIKQRMNVSAPATGHPVLVFHQNLPQVLAE